MRPVYWTLGITLAIGAFAGLAGGQATTAGLVQPAPAAHHIQFDHGGGGLPGDGGPGGVAPARIASACQDCSDYDLGFRFAASRHLTTSAECMDYSWSYQRGCLAYLREG